MKQKQSKQKAQAKSRKQAQREREKQMGLSRIDVVVSASVREQLEQACQIRGGVSGAYELSEYIETLIRLDAQKLEQQLDELGSCGRCGDKLPEGCKGVFKGEAACWHSLSYRELMLDTPKMTEVERSDLINKFF